MIRSPTRCLLLRGAVVNEMVAPVAYPERLCSRPPFGYANKGWHRDNGSPKSLIAPTSGSIAMVSASFASHVFNRACLPTTALLVADCVLSPSRQKRHGLECESNQRFSPLHNLMRHILNVGACLSSHCLGNLESIVDTSTWLSMPTSPIRLFQSLQLRRRLN